MDRLIHKEDGDFTCNSRDFDKVFPTLHAYEETGLTPEKVTSLKHHNDSLIRQLEETTAELAALRSERNTMAAVLKKLYGCGACKHCSNAWNKEPCITCRRIPNSPKWEWSNV